MFTHKCFIRKNTEELRSELRRRGYVQSVFDENDRPWLATNYGMFSSVSEDYERLPISDVDCGENEILFLAIASLRDDNDAYQWFTDGHVWEFTTEDLPSKYMQINGHKCTVEELLRTLRFDTDKST